MDVSLLDTLLTITTLFQKDMARYFAGTALTESRVAVLWVVHAQGPSSQQSIASALGASARSVSGLVDALESDGYVTRGPHPSDRRAVLVTLTAASTDLMTTMHREHEELDAALRAAVAPGDAAAFERGIAAVADRLGHLVRAAEADPAAVDGPDR